MVICRSPINISAINSCTSSEIDIIFVRKMTDPAASYSIYKIGVFKWKSA
jgi:hypothetical protein